MKGIMNRHSMLEFNHLCNIFFFSIISLGSFFFLSGPIWARTVFCIDIGNIVFMSMVKIHLPHMYMIFVECKRKQVCSSILQYRQTFQHFQDHKRPSQALRPFWKLEIFLVELYNHYWPWNKKGEKVAYKIREKERKTQEAPRSKPEKKKKVF